MEMASLALGYITDPDWRPGRRQCSAFESSPMNSRRGIRRRSVRRWRPRFLAGSLPSVSSPGVVGTAGGALLVAAHPGADSLSSILENIRPHAGFFGSQRY